MSVKLAPPANESDRRRTPSAKMPFAAKDNKRYFDEKEGVTVVKLFSGDWHVSSTEPEMLMTILGSCVAACIRDPFMGIGGMNHFLLPGDESSCMNSDAARYGVFAMESLINGLLKAGARKERLEIKVFGGGNVINNSARIGSKNAAFIREFLRKEGLRIASEDLEGDLPRKVHYYTQTGKVMMRKLNRQADLQVVAEEQRFRERLIVKPPAGDIELF
jgi:chemotaxis protein CheD